MNERGCLLRVLLIALSMNGLCSAMGQHFPCLDGMAGPYPCDAVHQLGSVNLTTCAASGANDVWGWVDEENGGEYALLGLNNGLAFIDVTDPYYPVYMGKLPTASSNSLWRDMKVHDHYVYVVSEAFAHGLQVFDLHTLREVDNAPEVFIADTTLHTFSDAHNLAVNSDAACLYVVGTNLAQGGVLIYDISNPLQPELIGMHGESGYVHDLVGFTYDGPDADHVGSVLLACAHPTHWSILDATDPGDVVAISTGQHPSNGYTHQPMLTPSAQHLLIGDELDEQLYGFNTRTLWWNISDLDEPSYGGAYFGTTPASDHNQYVLDHFIYQSNYTSGLRILRQDESSGLLLEEVAFFDVEPESNEVGFTGSWSNYPFLPSGNVLVSSMDFGLHILRPNWLLANFSSSEICQNDTAVLTVTIPKDLNLDLTLSVDGLPSGVEVLGMPFSTYGTGTWACEVVGLSSSLGAIAMDVLMSSGSWEWRERVQVVVDGGEVWFQDADGDGFGDPNHPVILCSPEPGYASNSLDCYDLSAYAFPGAAEQCDAQDNDCNGLIDDGLAESIWFRDLDGDGYGNAAVTSENCYCPAGFVEFNGDCDDHDPFTHPNAPPNQTGVDNNCDGILSEMEQNPCPGDFNLDEQVTVSDLLVILFDYACMSNCSADMSGDGMVAMEDLLLFLSVFNVPCTE